jgi:hypothetical protein
MIHVLKAITLIIRMRYKIRLHVIKGKRMLNNKKTSIHIHTHTHTEIQIEVYYKYTRSIGISTGIGT